MDMQKTIAQVLACVGGADNLLAISQRGSGLNIVVADRGNVDRQRLAGIAGAESSPEAHGRLRITLHGENSESSHGSIEGG